jgi:hypothetical protein
MAQSSVSHSKGCLQHALRIASLSLLLIFATPYSHAQGCAQCRDNTATTPPQTQAAYRHAILLLTGVAAILFGSTIFLLKRDR